MGQRSVFLAPRRRKLGGILKPFGWCLLPCFLGLGIIWLSRAAPPQTVEEVYSQHLFRWISAVFGLLGRAAGPFSAAGLILALLALVLAAALASLPILLWKRPRQRRKTAAYYLCGAVLLPSLILLLFAVTCAPNYSRPTFAEQSGLEIRPSSVDELTELCLSLLQRTNDARDALGEQNTTGMSFSETSKRVQSAFHTLSSEYPFLGQPPIAAKPMIFSEILSSFNLTGFYFPYTAEANVNVHMPDTELPFTIGHELAHTCGFMREDEANFIGYLACLRSDEPYIRYSGLYCALSYSMNALYSVSPERYFAIRKHYHERLKADAAALSAYWQPYFHTPAAKLSDAVNDTYLKANNLTDGVHSYGRMVDLLLAEARAEISDTTL